MSQKFGQVIDKGLADHLREFHDDNFSQYTDYIGRKRVDDIFRLRRESVYHDRIYPLWSNSAFPKNLFEFVVTSTNPFITQYYKKSGEPMLVPRMHEISNSLGISGIAAVVQGTRFYSIS